MQDIAYRILLITILSAAPGLSAAQTDGVVADMKSRLPIRDAKISTSSGHFVTTDYLGRFHIPKPFTSATVSCRGYMQRNIKTDGVPRDTIFLIPLANTLAEVEITASGTPRTNMTEMVRKHAAQTPRTNSGLNFDFFRMFDKSVRYVSKKEREKQKRILDNY